MNIRIGTSGYSYDSWKNTFYPAGLRGSEQLSYYASCFPVVELNTTYYGMPKAETLERMMERAPAGFEFVVKAHQDLTHAGRDIPESHTQFREALRPLQDAGALGCVLAQFPPSFRRGRDSADYLARMADRLAGISLVVEFRNAEWAEERTFELLRRLNIGYCCVDEPRLTGLLPPIAAATSNIGYVRFHGRNAASWHRHNTVSERYNYLYNRDELSEWKGGIQEVASQTERTYVFFNNCHGDQAPRNAWQMAEILDVTLPRPSQPQGLLALFDE